MRNNFEMRDWTKECGVSEPKRRKVRKGGRGGD
jgi:hypothetical protein